MSGIEDFNPRNVDLRPIALHHRITQVEQHAAAMIEWKKSIDASTSVQREMIVVGRDIIATLRVLGWIGKASKWVVGMGAGVYTVIQAFKFVGHV